MNNNKETKVLYKVKENFEEVKERLGVDLFNSLYGNSTPKEYDVIDEEGDEIKTLQPFEFAGEGIKILPIWSKRNQFVKI
jgi:hypothetical protein